MFERRRGWTRDASPGVRPADDAADYSPLPPPVRPLPRHVAIIMDGNGRWARRQGFLRLRGHERGAESLRAMTRYCARIGIAELTLYALSTENYRRRPAAEVEFLMRLLRRYLIDERAELARGNVRLRAVGRTWELPEPVRRELDTTVEGTASHTGMVMRLALNYGGRSELLDAFRGMLAAVQRGELDPDDLDERAVGAFLYDPTMSDADLVVRTAGEARLSNFLLWQASYAEIWVTEVLWPEFRPEHLVEALGFFATRRRKFGAVEPAEDPQGRPPRASSDSARLSPGA